MDRRAFIQRTCLACGAVAIMPGMLVSCASARAATGTLDGDDLVVPFSAFLNEKGSPRPYLLVSNAQLNQPIAVFRSPEGSYRAVLMRCTHRGADLQVVGERLECAAHGSLFDSTGAVLEGPASSPLRTFPVVERDSTVRISLKA